MASRRPPGDPGGPCLWFCGLFRQFHVNVLWTHCIQSVSLVFRCYVIYGTVTSCVTSRCHTCTGHMTFYYKRSASTLFGAILTLVSSFGSFRFLWLLVHPSGLPLSPTYSWCLMRVGRNASSASPGWSLLPSSIVIVLALANSTVSPKGT